jgi:hypothetical protein
MRRKRRERRNRERVQKFRERVMRAIDIDASAYLQKVSAVIGPDGQLGEPQIIRSASDLTKAVDTFLQLAGEPQKHEVSATVNANVESEWRVDPRPNGDLMAVLAVLQELAPLIPPAGGVDGAIVDAVRLALAELGATDAPTPPAP